MTSRVDAQRCVDVKEGLIPFKDLPLYSYDYDKNYPPVATAFKDAIAAVDAVLVVTPEYNRSIPGGLKNAIEAYIQFQEGMISEAGEVSDDPTRKFLQNYMAEFHGFITRVYTVLPRNPLM